MPSSITVVREAVTTLLHDADPMRRSKAHTTLGEKALANDDLDTAEVHLKEAADLDPTDEVPRTLLQAVAQRQPKARSWMRFFRA